MKNFLTAVILLTFFISGSLFAVDNDQIKQVDRSFSNDAPAFLGYKTDELIVVMKDNLPSTNFNKSPRGNMTLGVSSLDIISEKFAVSKFARQFQGSEKSTMRGASKLSKYFKVKINDGNLDDAITAYEADPMVDHVEKIGMHLMYGTPNDSYYDPYQWYHNQANDDDIDSPEAWDIQTGNSSIIIAILDSGTRYYHQDLGGVNASSSNPGASRGNMWINDAELNGSAGVDDDGNGYTDDWIGYDFIDGVDGCWAGEDCVTKDNDPRDFNGHGTHTSGIMGMITNDGYGMAGVAGGWGNGSQAEYGNGVKIMACRMGYSYNYHNQEYGVVMMDAAAEAFYYAANNGAKVASCSWGSSNSGGIDAAVDYFIANDGLIFVASGNDGSETPGYLNSRTDCISVSATDENDAAATFTTYGTWVDISAPGVGIYSTFHDHTDPTVDYWASMDGTSMACPMAAATGAMIWSQNPTWTASQVEDQLYASADNIDAELLSQYIGKMGAGRINLYNAVNTGTPPPPVANFSGSPVSGEAPFIVNFTDLSSNSPTSWNWNFGDGGSSTAQNPSYNYTTAGTYTVTLTATNAYGSDDEVKVDYITVTAPPNDPPVANFSGSPTSGDASLNVSFTDLSTYSPTSWSWTFGDGGTSTEQNPSYTYNTAGTYTVTLTATNAYGSDDEVKVDYITVTDAPEATKTFANADISVLGTFSGGFVNTFASDNSYETITEAESTNHPRKVTSNAEHKWTFDLGSGGSNMAFYMEGYRNDNSDGDDFVFEYSTDDVTYLPLFTVASSSEQTYSEAVSGLTGTVYVRVSDDNRSWDLSALDNMYVDYMYFEYSTGPIAPTADFVGTPTSGNVPLTVNFTDLSTGAPDTWAWTFGDGGTSTAQNPSYVYNTVGTYTVTLTVTNTYGSDVATKTDYITVTEAGSNASHVGAMSVGRTKTGPNYLGTCTVTIFDQGNAPLANATVYVDYDGPTSGSLNGVTSADGTVSFQGSSMKRPAGEWCFEVTNVTSGTHPYDAGSNAVTRACESGPVYKTDNFVSQLLPSVYALDQNHPNPFNPATGISFSLPKASHVTLTVYNIMGQKVAELANGEMPAGNHAVEWDASAMSSGVYLYRLETNEFSDTKKMLLIK